MAVLSARRGRGSTSVGKVIPFPQKQHDKCPKCGKLSGPYERLGSGICNECLTKKGKKHARTNRGK